MLLRRHALGKLSLSLKPFDSNVPSFFIQKLLSFEEGVSGLLPSHILVRDFLDYNDPEILVEVVVLLPEMLIDTD